MRKILVLLSLGLVALNGCKKDSTPSLVENTVLPPATETFAPGAAVTIKGSGFTAADEIWFRAQTKATDDIQATVTKQTATEITFIVPLRLPAGEQTVLLKRDDREMPLGKITVAEPSAAAKLYGIGSSDNGNTTVFWEIDKTTGKLTEIISIPGNQYTQWESLVTDPTSGLIYCNKSFEDPENDFAEQSELYRIDPDKKTIEKVGLLTDQEDTHYSLCLIDGRLHALIDQKTNEEEHHEVLFSLVSIDPNTAAQTSVADFGSLQEALGLSNSINIDTERDLHPLVYDPISKSLIVPIWIEEEDNDVVQLTQLNIADKKIIPGEKSLEYFIPFLMDNEVYGAFYTENRQSIDFRAINTESLTIGSSIGQATLSGNDQFGDEDAWHYDAATGTGYCIVWKAFTTNEHSALGTYHFNSKEFKEAAEYSEEIELWWLCN